MTIMIPPSRPLAAIVAGLLVLPGDAGADDNTLKEALAAYREHLRLGGTDPVAREYVAGAE